MGWDGMIQKTLRARAGAPYHDVTVVQTGPVIEIDRIRLLIDSSGEVAFEPGWERDARNATWWWDICRALGWSWRLGEAFLPRGRLETRADRIQYLTWVIDGGIPIAGLGRKGRLALAEWLGRHPDGEQGEDEWC